MTEQHMLRLYIAAPLFSEAERQFNRHLKELLSPYFNVYLPQEDAGLLRDILASDTVSQRDAKRIVFRTDVEAIRASHIILVVLDGALVEEGVAWELGFAFALGKPCIGLQTDDRRRFQRENNPMVECSIETIFRSVQELVDWARDYRPSVR